MCLRRFAEILSPDFVTLSCNTSSIAAKTRRIRTQNILANRSCPIMRYCLKKDPGADLAGLKNREKAVIIGALGKKYALPMLLAYFNMARSSYYYQKASLSKPDKYMRYREKIKSLFRENRGGYGYRRLHQALKQEGIILSEKVVRQIMKDENLVVFGAKQKKYSSYLGEITPEVENVLCRNFHADNPNEKWLTDITKFALPEGKPYLSPLIDCFDGLVVNWTVGRSPNAALVNTMLDQAIAVLPEEQRPIIHTDRGCHYRWPGWIERMERTGLTRSMFKKDVPLIIRHVKAFWGA